MEDPMPVRLAATSTKEAPRPMSEHTSRSANCLRAEGVSKRFPGVLALQDVSVEIRGGEVHVLFGENGAGKSTLVNVFVGNYRPDSGAISLDGQVLELESPADGRGAGINAVFQEFSLVPTLTVAANIFLGREELKGHRLDDDRMRKRARDVLRELGFDIDPDTRVSSLTRAEQQMVEIAKALQGDPRVLILDEPTASLTERETDVLFDLVRRFRDRGLAIIYITHRVQEIQRIADRVTVLRDGHFVATIDAKEADESRLVELMTGRKATALYPSLPARTTKDEVLRLDRISTADGALSEIGLNVMAGEIVGLAGLVGSGKDEIGQVVFGLKPYASGSMSLFGKRFTKASPREMLKSGVYYLPPDRRSQGLYAPLSLEHNASIAAMAIGRFGRAGILQVRREKDSVRLIAERLSVRPWHPGRPVSQFSGGNQQKALIARGLLVDPKLVILNEPTTGVDVGARAEIYQIIADLCEQGVAVLLISSDLPEILHLCHRAYSVAGGTIRGEFADQTLSEAELLSSFFREGQS
jgi:ribose transport system ATP-binding protein